MRMSAARIGGVVFQWWFIAPPSVILNRSGIVSMIGDGLDIVVSMRIEVLTCLPYVTAILNHVVQMWNHTGGDKRLTMVVKINAPGIGSALGISLEHMSGGVYRQTAAFMGIRWSLGVPGLPTRL